MVSRTIRFTPGGLRAAEQMAASKGISLGEFVREAVLGRIAYEMGRDGDELNDVIISRLEELRDEGDRDGAPRGPERRGPVDRRGTAPGELPEG